MAGLATKAEWRLHERADGPAQHATVCPSRPIHVRRVLFAPVHGMIEDFSPRPEHKYQMATSSKAKKRTVRLASGRKRARQDVKLNAHNSSLRSKFRTVIKNVQKAVAAGDGAKAADLFKSAQQTIDSIADKGLFHKNKAARHKSRLAAKVKALAAPAAA